MGTIPDGFALQRQVKKLLEDRGKMAAGALEINWGFAENMAYATLLADGYPVRMTGQDVGRGLACMMGMNAQMILSAAGRVWMANVKVKKKIYSSEL